MHVLMYCINTFINIMYCINVLMHVLIHLHVLINYQVHLLGHIACFGRCGLSTAYFTELNE